MTAQWPLQGTPRAATMAAVAGLKSLRGRIRGSGDLARPYPKGSPVAATPTCIPIQTDNNHNLEGAITWPRDRGCALLNLQVIREYRLERRGGLCTELMLPLQQRCLE
ncbi:hypothetical protein Pcinc_019482 [Petrolisthes cinctipes]|uniref:Uncharacterized protein n=1 Tax=Petrolisthes cinctipes TaxID=88211 RepID=A0AAE1FJZ7_PETCI|nr:hypothetical protein Pcinc_019482 [Petrolisthes cinctipes]